MTYSVRFGYDIGGTLVMGDEKPELAFDTYEEAATYGRGIRRATGLLHLRYVVFSQEAGGE